MWTLHSEITAESATIEVHVILSYPPCAFICRDYPLRTEIYTHRHLQFVDTIIQR